MNYFIEPFKKFLTFSGRARRKEYWLFALGCLVMLFIAAILDGMRSGGNPENASMVLFYLVYFIYWLPMLAVSVRRLHDTDRSGWWVLLGITGIGGLVLLVFFVLEGTKGENRFGDDPKDED